MCNACAGRDDEIASRDGIPCLFPIIECHLLDEVGAVLLTLVPLQADEVGIDVSQGIEERLQRETAILLMFELGIALPTDTDDWTLVLGIPRPRDVWLAADVLVLVAKGQENGHGRNPEVMVDMSCRSMVDDHLDSRASPDKRT